MSVERKELQRSRKCFDIIAESKKSLNELDPERLGKQGPRALFRVG